MNIYGRRIEAFSNPQRWFLLKPTLCLNKLKDKGYFIEKLKHVPLEQCYGILNNKCASNDFDEIGKASAFHTNPLGFDSLVRHTANPAAPSLRGSVKWEADCLTVCEDKDGIRPGPKQPGPHKRPPHKLSAMNLTDTSTCPCFQLAGC
ncbi:hypothetical protein DdX_15613 [Ditylenchus destructor]|uniref:Uncharacterized protein n=1 Tax=Ditylenchus destructor TaxID=166010 RepID=A0AAD4MV01_9BILA|nr:hypothetical protein DdX_15613 [Ditylenchus destructor]